MFWEWDEEVWCMEGIRVMGYLANFIWQYKKCVDNSANEFIHTKVWTAKICLHVHGDSLATPLYDGSPRYLGGNGLRVQHPNQHDIPCLHAASLPINMMCHRIPMHDGPNTSDPITPTWHTPTWWLQLHDAPPQNKTLSWTILIMHDQPKTIPHSFKFSCHPDYTEDNHLWRYQIFWSLASASSLSFALQLISSGRQLGLFVGMGRCGSCMNGWLASYNICGMPCTWGHRVRENAWLWPYLCIASHLGVRSVQMSVHVYIQLYI